MLHLLATTPLFFTCLWLDLTVTVSVHFPYAQTNIFNCNISFQTQSDSYRECLEESMPWLPWALGQACSLGSLHTCCCQSMGPDPLRLSKTNMLRVRSVHRPSREKLCDNNWLRVCFHMALILVSLIIFSLRGCPLINLLSLMAGVAPSVLQQG